MPTASEIDKPVNLNISDGVKPNRTKFDTLYLYIRHATRKQNNETQQYIYPASFIPQMQVVYIQHFPFVQLPDATITCV